MGPRKNQKTVQRKLQKIQHSQGTNKQRETGSNTKQQSEQKQHHITAPNLGVEGIVVGVGRDHTLQKRQEAKK